VAHHYPGWGDNTFDRMLGIRNARWFAWRRRPLGSVVPPHVESGLPALDAEKMRSQTRTYG